MAITFTGEWIAVHIPDAGLIVHHMELFPTETHSLVDVVQAFQLVFLQLNADHVTDKIR